jgi:hypothetical protein
MGLRFSLSSLISFLNWSIVCAMRLIFSSVLLSAACALLTQGFVDYFLRITQKLRFTLNNIMV